VSASPCAGELTPECDEGRYCERHFAEERDRQWKAYERVRRAAPGFENATGHTYGCICDECMDEYRSLKR
jgi:hypothetical protein